MATNAIPDFAGNFEKSCRRASSPPADAPIATMGKEDEASDGAGASTGADGSFESSLCAAS